MQRLSLGTENRESEELEIKAGSGSKLGDIENVKRRLELTKATEPELTKLYSICFGRRGTQNVTKKHLREFSGFTEDSQRATAKDRISSAEVSILKLICGVLDLAVSGSKAELIERILNFLENPVASGREFQPKIKVASGTKRKSSGSAKKSGSGSKKKKTEKSGEKRPLSSFFKFQRRHRAEIKAENPGFTLIEVSKALGEKWRALSKEEQERYKDDDGDEETGSEGSESSEDESPPPPPVVDQPSSLLSNTIRSAVSEILRNSDLSSTSLKAVREKLKENAEIGGENVERYKEWINQNIKTILAKLMPQ